MPSKGRTYNVYTPHKVAYYIHVDPMYMLRSPGTGKNGHIMAYPTCGCG